MKAAPWKKVCPRLYKNLNLLFLSFCPSIYPPHFPLFTFLTQSSPIPLHSQLYFQSPGRSPPVSPSPSACPPPRCLPNLPALVATGSRFGRRGRASHGARLRTQRRCLHCRGIRGFSRWRWGGTGRLFPSTRRFPIVSFL